MSDGPLPQLLVLTYSLFLYGLFGEQAGLCLVVNVYTNEKCQSSIYKGTQEVPKANIRRCSVLPLRVVHGAKLVQWQLTASHLFSTRGKSPCPPGDSKMKKTNLQLVKSQGQCHSAVRALGPECLALGAGREDLVEEGLETWVESGHAANRRGHEERRGHVRLE